MIPQTVIKWPKARFCYVKDVERFIEQKEREGGCCTPADVLNEIGWEYADSVEALFKKKGVNVIA